MAAGSSLDGGDVTGGKSYYPAPQNRRLNRAGCKGNGQALGGATLVGAEALRPSSARNGRAKPLCCPLDVDAAGIPGLKEIPSPTRNRARRAEMQDSTCDSPVRQSFLASPGSSCSQGPGSPGSSGTACSPASASTCTPSKDRRSANFQTPEDSQRNCREQMQQQLLQQQLLLQQLCHQQRQQHQWQLLQQQRFSCARAPGVASSMALGPSVSGKPSADHQQVGKVKHSDSCSQELATGAGGGCWEVDPAELTVLERVGVGATAEVYRADWLGTYVAVKRMLVPFAPSPCVGAEQDDALEERCQGTSKEQELGKRLAVLENQRRQQRQNQQLSWFRRELGLLQELRHPNLVLFMGAATQGEGPPLIVSEFCEGGTLFRLLQERPQLRLSWAQKLKAASDTAKGMNFLHRRKIIHRDLKSLNILLSAEVTSTEDVPAVKISDFGLSRRMPSQALTSQGSAPAQHFISKAHPGAAGHGPASGSIMTGGLGTCLWMAPEVLAGGVSYDERADVYSYAVVLFELICRRLPFDGALGPGAMSAAARAVCAGKRPDLRHVPPCCPAELRQLMEQCWAQSAEARPAFTRILEDLSAVSRNATMSAGGAVRRSH